MAARFASPTRAQVERAFAEWQTRRAGELSNEFNPQPYLDQTDEDVLLIFPIRPDARLWKDYTVEATHEADVAGGEFLGFLDRVTGLRRHE